MGRGRVVKIVFFGTPDYVTPILMAIHRAFTTGPGKSPIIAVVTQSPKDSGRKKILTYSAVDHWGYKHKLPVYFNPLDLIKNDTDAQLGVLAAYGSIIPSQVIKLFPHGILNIHPSLLPKFRGASPIQAGIISDQKETGVSIIKIDEQLDHGPIVSQFKEQVLPDDTTETLRRRLFERSAEVLVTLIDPFLKGKITLKPQNHEEATFTKLLKKEYGFIPPEYLEAALSGQSLQVEWKIPFMKTKSSQASLIKDFAIHPTPVTIHNFIRAMYPWPIAWTLLRLSSSGQAKRLKILEAHLDPDTGHLTLATVQLEGKTPVSWQQFKEAYPNSKFAEDENTGS